MKEIGELLISKGANIHAVDIHYQNRIKYFKRWEINRNKRN